MRKLSRRVKDSIPAVPVAHEDAEELYGKRIRDLESVNEALKREVQELRSRLADASLSSSVATQRSLGDSGQTSSAQKEKTMSSSRKSNLHSICSTKKHKTESPIKQFDNEVQKLKAQKVKLQCKIKLDSMHFRLLKASLEKEILHLKKEQRKSEFEKHILSALNSRQKLILQLKNAQALTALKRLKSLLQSKNISPDKDNGPPKETSARIQEFNNDFALLKRLNNIHSDYERQMKEIAEEIKSFSLEASVLKAELEGEQNSCSASCDNQVNHTPTDSELKELTVEFNKLCTMVSQMEISKSQATEAAGKVQVNEVEYSVSAKNSSDPSDLEASPLETSQETPNNKNKAEVCCSCTKNSLCKTQKCKCRANGSGCGNDCGCIVSKCSNRKEMVRSDGKKSVGISHDDKERNKQPLRDIGNIQGSAKVVKLKKKVQKRVGKK